MLLSCRVRLFDVVDVLLAKGAEVNARDKSGATALIFASQDDENREEDNLDVVNALSPRGPMSRQGRGGATALMLASMDGLTDIVEALLAKGADVNAGDKNGATALMLAAEMDSTM